MPKQSSYEEKVQCPKKVQSEKDVKSNVMAKKMAVAVGYNDKKLKNN